MCAWAWRTVCLSNAVSSQLLTLSKSRRSSAFLRKWGTSRLPPMKHAKSWVSRVEIGWNSRMAKQIIDLSIYLENEVISDPEPFRPKIEYIDHKMSVPQLA